MRNYSEAEIKEVTDLYWLGKSLRHVKFVTGRDIKTIKQILVSQGVTIRSLQEQCKLSPRHSDSGFNSYKLTAMEVLACCAYGSGLDPKEIAYRMGYRSPQSVRDILKSASRKIRAREQADIGGQL